MTSEQQPTRERAAVRTLERLGYAFHGAELWKPPIGPRPNFDLNDRLREALTKIRDSDYLEGEWPIKVAREALGE